MNILQDIVVTKKAEIAAYYDRYDLETLRRDTLPTPRSFYTALAAARAKDTPFFIAEFKRKSPSEGWIKQDADLPQQLRAYANAGAGAISVLSDEPWFGGTYADLALATKTLDALGPDRPLLLQKDFILDPIQIYLARQQGADLILLIAAILEPDQMLALRHTAESLGMGVLTEIHDASEWEKIKDLSCPVIGINSRDLKTFRTALNRVNVLRRDIRDFAATVGQYPVVVAESGVRSYRDFYMLRGADAFLIGTGLMRGNGGDFQQQPNFARHFQAPRPYLFKACGLRIPTDWQRYAQPLPPTQQLEAPDFVGINFSPISKRRPDEAALAQLGVLPAHFVAVFYKNSEDSIRDTLARYPFQTIQLYADDVTPDFVRSLKQRIFLALPLRNPEDIALADQFAPDIDLFLLDGAAPGSGQPIGANIPLDFPYPFLLAGGINEQNLAVVKKYPNCIGVDIASGIETEGMVDAAKIERIGALLVMGA